MSVRARIAPVFGVAALAFALALAGCSAPGTSTDATEPANTYSYTSRASTPATTEQAATTTQVEDVSHRLPYKGMDASLIDSTWLGVHDDTDKIVQNGQLKGSLPYQWRAQNGTGDMVFAAYVRDGKVVRISKFNLNTDYWVDATGRARTLPDRTATGTQASASTTTWRPNEDPSDYASPDEYADNAEGEFAAHGSVDPWNEAYTYWEDNA